MSTNQLKIDSDSMNMPNRKSDKIFKSHWKKKKYKNENEMSIKTRKKKQANKSGKYDLFFSNVHTFLSLLFYFV